MTGEVEPAPAAGIVLCDARTAACRCRQPAGHYPDTPHECAPPCAGQWFGEGDDIQPVRLPHGGDVLAQLAAGLARLQPSDDPDW